MPVRCLRAGIFFDGYFRWNGIFLKKSARILVWRATWPVPLGILLGFPIYDPCKALTPETLNKGRLCNLRTILTAPAEQFRPRKLLRYARTISNSPPNMC